uniref:Uncharacterized protein n=1 Tax=Panagrolaimus sp. ES5 TaxID=591445 RepID=A0AC34F5C5_9BILA
MTRMDGVDDLSKIDFIAGGGGKSLRQWILTGCNLKVLNETDFNGLNNLEELDIRVNLLETIEAGSFAPLKNLQKLSLAGNFLNETSMGPEIWKGLKNLDTLDLGWNELFILPADSFKGLNTLTSLSLRHNEKLQKIEMGAFTDLNKVQFLNLSGTAMTKIEHSIMKELISLQEIHLSNCNISSIEAGTFDLQKSTLQKLSLNGNQLRNLDIKVLKELYSIQEIDLTESSRPFFLMGSSETKCSRPYTKEGLGILELTQEDLNIVYNATYDTTTTTTTTVATRIEATTASSNDFENITAINFEEIFHVVGVNGNDTLDAIEDARKPPYDINKVKYGQKTTSKNPTNSLFATIAGSALVVITVVSILLMVRHRRSAIRLNNEISAEAADKRISTSTKRIEKSIQNNKNNGVTTAV